MPYLILVGLLVLFIGLYVGAMQLNAKVEIPESCKEAYLEAQNCGACGSRGSQSSCNVKQTIEFLKEVKLDD
jgi:hypothetical protein